MEQNVQLCRKEKWRGLRALPTVSLSQGGGGVIWGNINFSYHGTYIKYKFIGEYQVTSDIPEETDETTAFAFWSLKLQISYNHL